MVAGIVIWGVVLAVFAYVYWKPGFKNSTAMVKFGRPGKAQSKGSLDLRIESGTSA